jgi:hypothetical protein
MEKNKISKASNKFQLYIPNYVVSRGHAVAWLVEALCYKPGSIPDEVIGCLN